jgi:hypothetical protein
VRDDITAKISRPQEGVAITMRWGEPNQSENAMALRLLDQRHGPVREAPRLAGKIMNRDLKNVLRSPDQSWDREVHVSPSELLSLLSSFHARLDAFFEEMRAFPEAATRQKTAVSRSMTVEHDLRVVSAQVGASGSTVVNGARNSPSPPQRAHALAGRSRQQ